MFYRTSEYEAAFGVQARTSPEPAIPLETASPWRRAIGTVGKLAELVAVAYRRRRAERAIRLTLSGLDDHLLRDIGITRKDFGALGIGDAFRSWSKIDRSR